MSRTIHCCLSVKGALYNWDPRNWVAVATDDDGKEMSPNEFKRYLLDELSKGHVVIPLGEPCEGFDYAGGGCPGHEVEGEEAR